MMNMECPFWSAQRLGQLVLHSGARQVPRQTESSHRVPQTLISFPPNTLAPTRGSCSVKDTTVPSLVRQERPHPAARGLRASHVLTAAVAAAADPPVRPQQDADLREDPHGQDHHPRGRVLGHDRQCQGQDPGQGGVRAARFCACSNGRADGCPRARSASRPTSSA
jgi:hypothetical protein